MGILQAGADDISCYLHLPLKYKGWPVNRGHEDRLAK